MTDPTLQDLRAAIASHTAMLLPPPKLAANARAAVSRRRKGNAVALVSVSGEPPPRRTWWRAMHDWVTFRVERIAVPNFRPNPGRDRGSNPGGQRGDLALPGHPFRRDHRRHGHGCRQRLGRQARLPACRVLLIPLFGLSTPSGNVLLFDISKLDSNTGNLAVFVRDAAGARVAYDVSAAPTSSGLAVRTQIGDTTYVVAVAAPGCSIVDALPDGRATSPVSSLPGVRTGAGWATFPDAPNSVQSIQFAKCQDGTCTDAISIPVQ